MSKVPKCIEKCKNHGGYQLAIKNVACGIDGKICAGYDRKCGRYSGTRYLRGGE